MSIRLPVGGLDGKYVTACWLGNITWNVRELIKQSSGWDIKNEDSNGDVLAWMGLIEDRILELESRPEEYEKYESPNGCGTIRETISFYNCCLDNSINWIRQNEDLLPVAVIWVS